MCAFTFSITVYVPRPRHIDVPSIELIYDSKDAIGRVKDYIEALLRMGFIARLFKKVERVYDKLLILGEEAVTIGTLIQTQKKT